MGCTSSAPPRAVSDDNATTEHNVKFVASLYENDMKGQDKITIKDRNETKDLKNVLPKCDTLAEPIQVISNSKKMTDLATLDNMRVIQEENNFVQNNNDNDSRETSQIHKISSLEKIVERLIETNVTDNNKWDHQNLQNEKQDNHNIDKQIVSLELNNAPINANEEDIQKDENCEEAVSPTHSVCSRVTRWEALADIAAELPPSLAVDPVTGQIYALSK